MRVEPAPYVFWNDDRRQRSADRRVSLERRETTAFSQPRARHPAHLWFAPAFGAQILGQMAPATVVPDRARRAYRPPEAGTPLRPSLVKSA